MITTNKHWSITISERDTDLLAWIEGFLFDRKAQHMSAGTVAFYRNKLWKFVSFCDTKAITKITEITASTIREFMLYLEQTGHNPGGIHAFYRSIRAFLYWWEDECTKRIMDLFGVRIEKKSFYTLGEYAKSLPDESASEVYEQWKDRMTLNAINKKQRNCAIKMYLALREELDRDPNIQGMGINCLNESHYSDSTPCLAWNMLYEEQRLIWGCEARNPDANGTMIAPSNP